MVLYCTSLTDPCSSLLEIFRSVPLALYILLHHTVSTRVLIYTNMDRSSQVNIGNALFVLVRIGSISCIHVTKQAPSYVRMMINVFWRTISFLDGSGVFLSSHHPQQHQKSLSLQFQRAAGNWLWPITPSLGRGLIMYRGNFTLLRSY